MTGENSEHIEWSPVKLIRIFQKTGALLNGHFLLSSGLHSDKYLQCARVLQYPEIAEKIGASIADKFRDDKPDCVIGPAIGGIVVAQEVGRALGVRTMFAERESGEMKLRRGFKVDKDERVLIVEDIITTGGSVKEVIEAVRGMGATVVGVGVIIDRSGGAAGFDVPFKPLAELGVEAFEEDDCPLCKKDIPLVKPGSRDI